MTTLTEMAVSARYEQWEAYYAAQAAALRLEAQTHRQYAAAARIWPLTRGLGADFHESIAAECDRKAAELEAKEQP